MEHDGEVLRTGPASGTRVQNTQYMFESGVTWPRIPRAASIRESYRRCYRYADKGPVAFTRPESDLMLVLAWLNSRPARCLIEAMANFGSYQVGVVQRMPWPNLADEETARRIITHAEVVTHAVRKRDEIDETTRSFVAPELARGSGTLAQRLEAWYARAGRA